MNIEKLTALKQSYEDFKQTDVYKFRVRQSKVSEIHKDIIVATLKNEPLENIHITGLIQMFKYGCSDATFDKYLAINVADSVEREQLSEKAYELEEWGYTGAGLNSVKGLTVNQLAEIKLFLLRSLDVNTIIDAQKMCNDFEQLKIPLIKVGIYSPWLYYIKPSLFPILNNSHNGFLRHLEIPNKYAEVISAFNEINELFGETDLGYIDAFAHTYANPESALDKNVSDERSFYKYSPGAQAARWENDLAQSEMSVDYKEYDFDVSEVASLEELNMKVGLAPKASANTTWNLFLFKNSKIGDVIFANKGKNTLVGVGIISGNYVFNSDRNEFRHIRSVNWIINQTWEYQQDRIPKYQTLFRPDTFSPTLPYKEILSLFALDYPEHIPILKANRLYYEGKNQVISTNKQNLMKQSLNQILYGPPGTGKTYKLKNDFFDRFTIRETEISKEQFMQQVLADLNWWQVITLVLLDKKTARVREIYDHPFLQVKEKISQSKTVLQTLWGQLQSHTLMDCENVNVIKRTEPLYFWKDDQSIWSLKEELVKDLYPEAYEILNQLHNFKPTIGKEIKLYEFVTFHQSYSYEDFIEGIKPNLEETEGEISYKIEDGIFKRLCMQAENNPEHNHALFIDEINRGNVSAIFGELITLIEDSKRKPVRESDKEKCKETIDVTLPYSKEKFSVPSNLYIIGTMNTADRSVEALDTALRRRFAFEEMMPEPMKIATEGALVDGILDGVDLAKVLTKINERIEVLLDADHQIGHSYLINVTDLSGLANAFNNCIIPLLKEYFYHDDEKIALVLGGGFVTVRKQLENVHALFPQMEGLEIHNIHGKSKFELKAIDASNIIDALNMLLAGA
ncbi:AAA family ATPase [Pedobacter helvus]|uniref:AAA family ATPase n=1 Tax=Pedobacter helvus TaxID=2563444 RepID=A0ABW9JJD3_9SPHI|nr:AAA family ATPase [Pedobacter ureilyticus]